MKTLKESILDKDFDVDDTSTWDSVLLKILDKATINGYKKSKYTYQVVENDSKYRLLIDGSSAVIIRLDLKVFVEGLQKVNISEVEFIHSASTHVIFGLYPRRSTLKNGSYYSQISIKDFNIYGTVRYISFEHDETAVNRCDLELRNCKIELDGSSYIEPINTDIILTKRSYIKCLLIDTDNYGSVHTGDATSKLDTKMSESILTGGAEASLDNVEIFEKAKKWLDSYATTVKGLKINEDGTLDADKITFRGRLGLYTLPDYIRLNYVKHYVVEGCQQWNGYKGYPKKCDKLYLEGLYGVEDLQNFEDSEIEWLIIVECHKLKRDLKIPKNHNIKSIRIARNNWGKYDDDYEKQFKRAHIRIVP